jgi:hypothetical protein
MGLPGLGGGGGITDILTKPLEKLTQMIKSGDPMSLLSSLGDGAKGGEDA